jgi:hypothetical protein
MMLDGDLDTILPIFKKCTATTGDWFPVKHKLPRDSWSVTYDGEPNIWFHDIFHADGTPYKQEEVHFLTQLPYS